MNSSPTITLRSLSESDFDAYFRQFSESIKQSGEDNQALYSPYMRSHIFDREELMAKFSAGLSTPLSEPDWTRIFGAFMENELCGHVQLDGYSIATSGHRTQLGLFVAQEYRRQRVGSNLMRHAIEWAKNQPGLSWIDIGVFDGNVQALELYKRLGFKETGIVKDRFRIDGQIIDDIQMSLHI